MRRAPELLTRIWMLTPGEAGGNALVPLHFRTTPFLSRRPFCTMCDIGDGPVGSGPAQPRPITRIVTPGNASVCRIARPSTMAVTPGRSAADSARYSR